MPTPVKTNLNDSTPAAPSGRANIKWQVDASRNISAHAPNIGGVDPRSTTSEQITITSQGKLVTFSNSGSIAVIVENSVGAGFFCAVENLGAGTATLTPSSGTINGAASLPLATGVGGWLFFDGTNWEATTGSGGAAFTAGGDLSGTPTSQEVIGIQNKPIDGGPTDGNVLTYSASSGKWEPTALPSVSGLARQADVQDESYTYAADSGAANAYVVTLSPVPAALVAGLEVCFKAANANTGASTLIVNSLGAKNIYKLNGSTALASGDIAAGQIVTVVYDGSYWQMQSSPANLPAPSVSTLGGVESLAVASHKWINTISTSGVPAATQPAVADLSDTPAINTVLAGASSGSPATPTFRSLVSADLPSGLATQTGVQDESYTYAADSGAANAYVVTLSPVPAALVAGLEVCFKAANANTGASTLNLNGLGAKNIYKLNGSTALASGDIGAGQIVTVVYDGSYWQMQSSPANLPAPSVSNLGGVESLAVASHKWINTISTSGVPAATQPAVADLSDTPAINTVLAGASSGSPATPTFRSLVSADLPSGLATQTGVQDESYTYAADSGAANAYVVTLSPVPAALVAGLEVCFKAANANTGASTLNLNGLGAKNIYKLNGSTALASGDIGAGQIVTVVYDGSYWQMQSSPANLPAPSVSNLGGVESLAVASHKWINTISTSGVPAATQPAVADLSDTPAINTVLAGASSGSPATPTFRSLVSADLPSGLATQTGVQDESYTYAADSGAANAYVVTLSPVPAALVAGLEVCFKAANANTGASTLNLNGLGAKNIYKLNGSTALASGDIGAGQIVTVVYDGSYWQMQSAPANSTQSGAKTDLSNLASPTAINDTTLTFTGAGGLAAGGSSQHITLSPSGSGDIIINTQGGQGIVLPAGGLVESLDSGSPSIVFGAEKILFNSSIGIRTIDPSYGGAVGSSLTIVQSDGLTAFAIGNSSLPRMAWNGNADGSWTIYDYAGGGWSVGMTQRAGKVGFSGNYSPVYTVDANGDINASGVFRDGGTAGVTQAASAVSTLATKGGIVTGFVTSDERLKRDVTPFVKGLDALRLIKPINFWWDKEKSGIESDHAWVGFSAQNVGKSIPEAASHIHENGMLDFNLAGVVAACVNAIQELEVIVKAQGERIAELERKLKGA